MFKKNWMKLLNLIILLLLSNQVNAKQIRIAVVDSGYNLKNFTFKLCNNNPGYDFTNTGMHDFLGHGQNISHIIGDNLKDIDYCLIPIKVFSFPKINNIANVNKALNFLKTLDVDIVNMSFEGEGADRDELNAINSLLKKGIFLVAAAGNGNKNLDESCDSYPVCYSKQIIGVGNWEKEGIKEETSNFGNFVRFWEIGTHIKAGGLSRIGTSQACAEFSAKLARQLYNNGGKLLEDRE